MSSSALSFPDYTYSVSYALPTTATFRHLRREVRMMDKTPEACAIGLPRSIFCVLVLGDPTSNTTNYASTGPVVEGEDQPDPRVVGMGRLIGDGALSMQIVDVIVLPLHQKRGLGKLIMRELTRWVEENMPKCTYLSMMADGESRRLYAQYGFIETASYGTVGMSYHPAVPESVRKAAGER
ncbi:hypothetical protein CALCODRAFT_496358 [Calocera cornea HHB12733]|uniref:N-acetyltransferase domain-containing protein n=1 Tax=Calocera cornea HHB12733 TaxID=1353952 RepID=A0A165FV16_9BASI|nr:hypothetical protein CALCODRAFT_496358 [Calocera cornea HHB12733]